MGRMIVGAVLGSVVGSVCLTLLLLAITHALSRTVFGPEIAILYGVSMGWLGGLVAGAVIGMGSALLSEFRSWGPPHGGLPPDPRPPRGEE